MSAIPIFTPEDGRLAPYRSLTDAGARQRAGLFVAEGRAVVHRLLAGGRHPVHSVLVTPPALAALTASIDDASLANVPIYVVDPVVMAEVAGFHVHRGCLALARRPALARLADRLTPRLTTVLVLEGVGNPDNIGGLFRSALAFGVELAVLGPGCGDPLYRKAIRTSMAATLDLPFVIADRWLEALDTLRGAGLPLLALTPDATAVALDAVDHGPRVALLCGAEGPGLSVEALARADARVRIPMTAGVDSLNVVVAASIALHHLTRAARR